MHKYRVMVVGRGVDFAQIYSPALEHAGYRVIVTKRPDDVMTMDGDPPDLIVTEVPAMLASGEDLVVALRRHPRLAALRVVAVTGWVTEPELDETRRGGATCVLPMPVRPMTLVDEVEKLLNP